MRLRLRGAFRLGRDLLEMGAMTGRWWWFPVVILLLAVGAAFAIVAQAVVPAATYVML